MKILWLTNVPLSKVRKEISTNTIQTGGWLDGMSDELLKDKDVEFFSIFPFTTNNEIKGKVDNINYLAFSSNFSCEKKQDIFIKAINEFNPDVIHIFGTEFNHTLEMLQVCEKLNILEKVVINIQGLCSKIADVYYSGLPNKVVNGYTLRDFIRRDNIRQQRKKFKKRGVPEIEAIKIAKNVIGRTDWDKACTTQINPNINYYFCDATLRNAFYSGKWNYEKCEKHSIFVSQSSYPIKGFHKLLQAMPLILQQYPDAKIYTTGKDLMNLSFKDKLKLGSYQKYLIKLIRKNGLENKIKFLGMLNEEKMKQTYLNSNCFVLCSSIENESNALGEAMILGVPSVASYVGGVPSRLIHMKDGYLYNFDEEYMLAYYVCKVFEDKECGEISENAIKHASECYSKKQNLKDLLTIYNLIYNGERK